MGQGSREVKRDMGFGQVRPVLKEAEEMAQGGGGVFASAHPQGPKPTPEPSLLCLKGQMLLYPKIQKTGLSPGGETQNEKHAKNVFF